MIKKDKSNKNYDIVVSFDFLLYFHLTSSRYILDSILPWDKFLHFFLRNVLKLGLQVCTYSHVCITWISVKSKYDCIFVFLQVSTHVWFHPVIFEYPNILFPDFRFISLAIWVFEYSFPTGKTSKMQTWQLTFNFYFWLNILLRHFNLIIDQI